MNGKIKISLFIITAIIFFSLFSFLTAVKAVEVDIKFQPEVPLGDETEIMDIGPTSIGTYIKKVYNYGVALGSTLAIIVIMVGGVIWLTSGGSPERVTNAKTYIGGAIAGLVLLLGSYLLLQTINPQLVELTLPDIPSITAVKVNCGWYAESNIPKNYTESKNPTNDCPLSEGTTEAPSGKQCYCLDELGDCDPGYGQVTKEDFNSKANSNDCYSKSVSKGRETKGILYCCLLTAEDRANNIGCCLDELGWQSPSTGYTVATCPGGLNSFCLKSECYYDNEYKRNMCHFADQNNDNYQDEIRKEQAKQKCINVKNPTWQGSCEPYTTQDGKCIFDGGFVSNKCKWQPNW